MPYRFFLLAPLLLGCSLSELLDDGGIDGGGIYNPDGMTHPPDDAAGPPKNMAFVRLAQLSPVLGPADFCLRPKGVANFDGPMLTAQLPNVDASFDAGAIGVPYPGVSGYLQVPALGATDIAVVSASDTSCSSPKLVGTVTIDPNKRMTVAVMGAVKDLDAGPLGLGIESFVDDTQPHPDATRLRIIHAALGSGTMGGYGSLSASIGYGNQVDPIAARIDPRHAASQSNTPPIVDSLGYASHAPITGQSSLRFAALSQMGGPWSTPPVDLGLAVNSVKTAFLVSVDSSFSVLLCGDLPSGGDVPCELYPAK